ncbi:hypothetical protein IW150_005975 [Coemansia sp. RSA 2607]|nr:hypothetical protein IW150_005975 [Coemansia sp. RSA 2607]
MAYTYNLDNDDNLASYYAEYFKSVDSNYFLVVREDCIEVKVLGNKFYQRFDISRDNVGNKDFLLRGFRYHRSYAHALKAVLSFDTVEDMAIPACGTRYYCDQCNPGGRRLDE